MERKTSGGDLICYLVCLAFFAAPLLLDLRSSLLWMPRRGHCGGQLTACKSNCKILATALEMYASDNNGHYPPSLQFLTVGPYLTVIPTCPAAKRVTYYSCYRVASNPHRFTFWCAGNNHARSYSGFSTSSTNFPQYFSESGLVDHP